jgi:EAL domain-containing protein (putative c-di-GMP-specific phosphodiesterase class I)
VSDVAQLRFLVVEDHGFQRWLIVNLLEELGARSVVSAPDGAAALHLLTAPGEAIDVIVSDLDMPGMDGMELIRRIAESRHPAALILVSSLDRPLIRTVEAMAQAYHVKLLGSIRKPLTAAKLKAMLRPVEIMRDRTPRSAAPSGFTLPQVEWGLRNGQFETHFQPKIELSTEQVRGAEALARWRHPERGLLRPADFIAVIEAGGLVGELTSRVVADAARACAEWRRSGIAADVSVNLSVMSLADVTLAERMLALVSECGLESQHVIFEITESAAAAEEGATLENLSRLKMRGFGLSIDDYGTGYSSMERLARIPFTELKIDQGFVRNAATHAASRAMVESSLELARKLGIVAVAEGIESSAEWMLLRELRCELGQGHYISPAIEASAFTRWARGLSQAAPSSRC